MIRISIYHWLPIAGSMLSEIEKHLHQLTTTRVSEIQIERDAIKYIAQFNLEPGARSIAAFPVYGKINQRGFCQHVLQLQPIPGMKLGELLDKAVQELVRETAEFLVEVAPAPVLSKLALCETGITSFQQFQSAVLDPSIERTAFALLQTLQLTAIMLDELPSELYTELNTELHATLRREGIRIPALQLRIPPRELDSITLMNKSGDGLLLCARRFHPDELTLHDSVIYKYAALVLYVRFQDHTIYILKQVREQLLPLYRRLALTLQNEVSRSDDTLSQVKRYLAYVDLKMQLLQKVIHRLQAARTSETFVAKIATFDEPAKVFTYPAIASIKTSIWQPNFLIEKIYHDSERTQALFDEDVREIQTISSEITEVLEASFLAQQLRISTQTLDATQTTLEIQRSTRNLANAHKWTQVVWLSTVGTFLAFAFGSGIIWAGVTGLFLLVGAYGVTTYALWRHRTHFRLVIPIHAPLRPDKFTAWISSQHVTKNETVGSQTVCAWQKNLSVRFFAPGSPRPRAIQHKFDITAHFSRQSFLNTITLETDYSSALFIAQDLVQAVFSDLRSGECLSHVEETSLYAGTLSQLEIPLDSRLPALNRLLTLPSLQINQIVKTGTSDEPDSLTKQDLITLQDLNKQTRPYIEWLDETLNSSARSNLLDLLGPGNVRQKLTLLERLEETHAKRI